MHVENPQVTARQEMTIYYINGSTSSSVQHVEVDGQRAIILGTRDGTPEDEAIANFDIFGLGNREQSIIAFSRMSEEEQNAHVQRIHAALHLLKQASAIAKNNAINK